MIFVQVVDDGADWQGGKVRCRAGLVDWRVLVDDAVVVGCSACVFAVDGDSLWCDVGATGGKSKADDGVWFCVFDVMEQLGGGLVEIDGQDAALDVVMADGLFVQVGCNLFGWVDGEV